MREKSQACCACDPGSESRLLIERREKEKKSEKNKWDGEKKTKEKLRHPGDIQ